MSTDQAINPLIEKILDYAKKRIEQSDLRNVDRTAGLFCDLLDELGETKKAEELDKFYSDFMGEDS